MAPVANHATKTAIHNNPMCFEQSAPRKPHSLTLGIVPSRRSLSVFVFTITQLICSIRGAREITQP
jgi:hypothetical protein